MKQLGSQEARRAFRDLLDDAQQGESAEITRNGKPVAVLVPVEWRDAVIDYIHATTFTREAADWYAREKEIAADAARRGINEKELLEMAAEYRTRREGTGRETG